MKIKYALFILAILAISAWGPFSFFSNNSDPMGSQDWIENQTKMISAQADNLDPYVLKLGLKAYTNVRKNGFDRKGLLTIIDYSKPSTERRMWVIDLKSDKILFNTYVAHGKNSGTVNATSFSNEPRTLKSSYGVFVTDLQPYVGHVGYSLRLRGLEQGINDNAYSRDIVIHGAWYVGAEVIQKYGQLGRSWGCPAVNDKLAKPIIDAIKNNTVVFAYYNNRQWLHSSPYLI